MLGQYTTRLHSVIKAVVVLIMIYILYHMYMNHTEIERFTPSVLMGRSTNVTSEYLNQVLYRIKKPLDVMKQASKIEPKKSWKGLTNLKNIIGMKCVNSSTVLMIDATQTPYIAYIADADSDHETLSAVFKINNNDRKIVKFVLGRSPISKSMYSMSEEGRVYRKDMVDVGSNRFKFVDDGATTGLTKEVNTNTNKAIDFAYTKHNNAVAILGRDGFLSEYTYSNSNSNYTRVSLQKGSYRMLNVVGNRQAIMTGNDSIKYMGVLVQCSGGRTDTANHICYGPSATFAYQLYYIEKSEDSVKYISSSAALFKELITKFKTDGQYYQMEMHEYDDDMYRLFVTFTNNIKTTYIVELDNTKTVTDVIKIPGADKFNLTSHGKYIFTKTSDVTRGVSYSNSTLTTGNKLLYMYPSDQHKGLGVNRQFDYTQVEASNIDATGSKKFGVFQVDFMNTSEGNEIQLFDMHDNNNLMLLTNTAIH